MGCQNSSSKSVSQPQSGRHVFTTDQSQGGHSTYTTKTTQQHTFSFKKKDSTPKSPQLSEEEKEKQRTLILEAIERREEEERHRGGLTDKDVKKMEAARKQADSHRFQDDDRNYARLYD
eukprot:GHVN01029139.1.p1 GENE.GHVN01029139.1~~GHVN01029139.1.p1  ORF type:complete len:119 (+),score=35.52 GHVN01029139.1:26-382(+)